MSNENVEIQWHGHSCFSISNSKYTIVLDPYKADMIGYPALALKAHAILASHQHQDHNYEPAVQIMPAPDNTFIKLTQSEDWPANLSDEKFWYKAVPSKHDASGGTQRGDNLIHVLHTAGITIAHLGDLGHILTDEQISDIGQVDLLLTPVGGHFTIDADQAVSVIEQLKPANIAPMHYKTGNGSLPIAPVDSFLEKVKAMYKIKQLNSALLVFSRQEEQTCFLFQF